MLSEHKEQLRRREEEREKEKQQLEAEQEAEKTRMREQLESHKNEIASQYSESDDEELSDNNETWITHLVYFLKCIKEFDWSNSFEDLPLAVNNKKGFSLLWLGNETFEKTFYP